MTGDGKVTSTPVGIDCPTACTQAFPSRGRRSSGATAAAGQRLESWGDACSGTGTCTVVMNGAKVVSAQFGPAPPQPQPTPPGMQPLTVAVTAGGSVTGTGIACPGTCVGFYAPGAVAALEATAAPGYDFAGWEGACSGAATCAPQIAGPTIVKAASRPGRRPGRSARPAQTAITTAWPTQRTHARALQRGQRCAPTAVAPSTRCSTPPGCSGRCTRRSPLHAVGCEESPGLGGAGAQLASGLRRIEQGAADAATGDVCPGARGVRGGVRTLKGAAQSAAKLIGGLQAKVMAEQLAPAFGDTAGKDVRWAELHLRLLLIDAAVADATDAQKAYGAACAALGARPSYAGASRRSTTRPACSGWAPSASCSRAVASGTVSPSRGSSSSPPAGSRAGPTS